MDLLKSHRRRSRLSESAYIILNVGLAATLFLLAMTGLSVWLAVALVLLSKWRAFAVRPRFWFANLVANTVDIIVSLSVVTLLYAATGVIWLQAVITLFFVVWLLFIKPRSKKSFVAAQAGVAMFMGVTALSIISFSWDALFFVAGMWVIGFCTARHVLGSYDEPLTNQYALVVGLAAAELGWVAYHWLFAYSLPGFGEVKLSQLAILATILAFIAERSYSSYHKNGSVMFKDVLLPILFAVAVFITLLIFYNGLSTGSI